MESETRGSAMRYRRVTFLHHPAGSRPRIERKARAFRDHALEEAIHVRHSPRQRHLHANHHPPDNQDEMLQMMMERARFMATQPGFVSVNLHRAARTAAMS
jgi:hypothetical protein